MRALRVTLSLGLVCAVAASDLTGQARPKSPTRPGSSRLQSLITRSIDQLEQPDKRLDALRRLENLGAATVPELKRLAHWQQRTKLSRQAQADVLYLLGQAGKPAAVAMPELREWLRVNDREIIGQLMATLTKLAPHCSAETCIALRREINNRGWRAPERSMLYHMLVLGQNRGNVALRKYLKSAYAGHIGAACRWICATHEDNRVAYAKLLPLVEQQLAQHTQRKRVSFWRRPNDLEGVISAAWLKLRTGKANESVARALLSSRQPQDRLRGVLWLKERGASLPVEKRADLVVRLWDGDASIATGAAIALAHWRQRGVPGLPALLLLSKQHAEPNARRDFATAATTIVKSYAALPANDAAWLRAASIAIGFEAAEETAFDANATEQPSATGKAALAELLMMACWNKTKHVGALLEVTERAVPDEDMTAAVYGWLTNDNFEVVDLALSWLARNRQHVLSAITEREAFEHRDECRVLPNWVPKASRGVAFEAASWFLTAKASTLDLHDFLDGRNTRLQARALAGLLTRSPERLTRILPRLHELANLSDFDALATRDSPDERWTGYPYQLAKPVRVLAALTLAHAGVTAADKNGLNQLAIDRCNLPLDELVAAVKKRREQGTLVEWIEALEAECRRGLYVPDNLQWPRAGTPPRNR